MGVLEAPTPGGRDLEVTMGRTVAAIGLWAVTTQVHIPWMDLRGQTGEEMIQVEIWNKPVKTRTPGRKNPGSLVRSTEEENKTRRKVT